MCFRWARKAASAKKFTRLTTYDQKILVLSEIIVPNEYVICSLLIAFDLYTVRAAMELTIDRKPIS